MTKPPIFISCGQYTEEEKELGKAIVRMVKAVTGLEPFFAEEVQDLNGLDGNILNALHNCVGFITVLHPRGSITRPDGSTVTRASVWIEQEIAIATYIQQIEKRRLPIIAFKHRSVSLEGIRSLLHLNPIEFTNKDDILIALAERLNEWKSLTPSGIQLQMSSQRLSPQEGHLIREFQVTLVNDTPKVIAAYSLKVDIPKVLLKHWSVSFGGAEVTPPDPNTVSLRYNQVSYGQIEPRSTKPLFRTQYCIHCGGTDVVSATITSEQQITATIWVEGNEYLVRKTVRELAT